MNIYDIENDEWKYEDIEIEWEYRMKHYRHKHSCLLLNNEIFVAGGYGWPGNSTAILNLQNNTWRPGPYLPKYIWNSQLVKAQPSSQYAAFLIGGYGYPPIWIGYGGKDSNRFLSDIYGLTKDLKSFKRIGSLESGPYKHVALVLPYNVVEKCVA